MEEQFCIRISKNYISDVTFNYFFSPILERYRVLESACQNIGKNSTPYDTTNAPYDPRPDSSLPGRDECEIRQ